MLLALLVPAQAWPQSALEQARALADGPAPADRLYDGASRQRTFGSSVAGGSGSGVKALIAAPAGKEKKSEIVVPSPKDPLSGPVAKRGAVKGGIIGGIIGAGIGAILGWAIGFAIGGPLALGLAIGISALAAGAAGAAIGSDVGRHCAVDPECG